MVKYFYFDSNLSKKSYSHLFNLLMNHPYEMIIFYDFTYDFYNYNTFYVNIIYYKILYVIFKIILI